MDEVKNDYIEKALNELIPIFGVRESVDQHKLISLINAKNIKECVQAIASYLGLPIKVNISYVPKGYRPSANDGFQSTSLVKTDWSGRGSDGITAQVSIPSNLPFYGTPRMVDFPINIRLSENCAENPATFISVMAHELSHIVLHSMWNKEKENEFYTDLAAMLLGFANIIKTGRTVVETNSQMVYRANYSSTTTTHTKTTKYGYLSDSNFDFALNKIKTFLSEQTFKKEELLEKIEKSQKQLIEAKKLNFYFEKYLEYLDNNLNRRISKEDVYKILAFHQPSHNDNFQSAIRKIEADLDNLLKLAQDLKITYDVAKAIKQLETQLESVNGELKKQSLPLEKDIDILKKYVGFFYKLKLKFWEKG